MPYIPLRIVEQAISTYQHIVFHSRMAIWITCLLVLLMTLMPTWWLNPFTHHLTSGMVVPTMNVSRRTHYG
jgi:hypothetical protein